MLYSCFHLRDLCDYKIYLWLAYRKSFEFEDIQGYRNRLVAMEYQKLHEELNGTTPVRLYCTQSEDNLYEDIIGMFPDSFEGKILIGEVVILEVAGIKLVVIISVGTHISVCQQLE